ncbi:DUF2938 domain-containing protein [Acinetobacter higginsii]|uniref:DUF2938 domain-containing protein n=1 Tax=Acinetobacter higginsii TaxID=70347 RepID=UPI0026763AF9|nr:DUF2938 domain-containing protein [Acinetobacter higginsii]MDO3665960.1 DUF2938 domain-containing protein [Acinetobacter higginsii]
METVELLFQILCLGVGATIMMDLWLLLLKRLHLPSLNFGFLGRWVGWIFRGKFIHASIAQSLAIRQEYALGWLAHYSVGILFAFSFVLIVGETWLLQPQFTSALIFGVITALIPFFVMQPAMGAGIASTKTTQPLQNCLRSLMNHTIFGCGLYLSAQLLALFH